MPKLPKIAEIGNQEPTTETLRHEEGRDRTKTKDKATPPTQLLKGWAAIASYLAIAVATAHRWAKDGMPVRREGRSMVADPKELSEWLGRESHMPAPAHVVTGESDLASALTESISAARGQKKSPK